MSGIIEQLSAVDDVVLIAMIGLGVFIIGFSAPFVFASGGAAEEERSPAPKRRPAPPDPMQLRADAPDRWLQGVGSFLEPKDGEELAAARLAMMRAGYRSRFALRLYYLSRALGAVGLSAATTVILFATAERTGLGGATIVLSSIAAGAVGYLAPMAWVAMRRSGRQEQIREAFPDSLDLMLVCVEAGQGLDQAIARVAREIEIAHPVLAEEYRILSAEIGAGRNRNEALRSVAQRTDVAEVASMTTVLIQSAETGASIGHALRVFASEMRDKRLLRAEEKANRLPVKLALGTMLFTVPPLLIVLVAPALVDLLMALSNGAR